MFVFSGASGRVTMMVPLLAIMLLGPVESSVVTLSDTSFKRSISSAPHFIKFFAPWCGHCKKMASDWEELAETDTGSVIIAEVDCTAHTGLCSEHGVTGYPTLKLFSGSESVEYVGGRTIHALNHFLSEQRKKIMDENGDLHQSSELATVDGLTELTDANFDTGISTGITFVKFFAPWCGHCKRMAPEWQSLAAEYESVPNVKVAKVDCTINKETCQQVGVRGYPTLLLYADGEVVEKYSGERSADVLSEYLDRQVAEMGSADDNDGSEVVTTVNGMKHLTEETFKVGVASGWTFVKFFAPWCGHCKKMAPAFAALAVQYEPNPTISIGQVDCTVEDGLCRDEEVSGYPSLQLYKDGLKVATYQGARTQPAMAAFIQSHVAEHDEL